MLGNHAPEGLEGSWEMVYGEERGKPIPEVTVRHARLVVTGRQHVARVGDVLYKGMHQPGPEPQAAQD